ncbi:MAG: ABC transporter permease, partial [Gemmatimonadota bacterium]
MIGPLRQALRQSWTAPGGRTGLVVLLSMAVIVLLAPPWLADPAAIPDAAAGALAPGTGHLFGTDQLNRDVLARLVTGGRVSLMIAGLAVALAMTLGAGVGLVAGYAGGLIDTILTRLVDGALAIPRIFLLLLLVLVWERVPVGALIVALGVTGWLETARLVRGEVLRLRREPYLLAARALGASPARIILHHLLPNATGPLLVAATLGLGDVILLEAGLSFLGLGIQPPTPSWGVMILEARPVLLSAPWAGLFPGAAIVITVLAANLVGDALQSAL